MNFADARFAQHTDRAIGTEAPYLALADGEILYLAQYLFKVMPLRSGVVADLLVDARFQTLLDTGLAVLGGQASPDDLNTARIGAIAAARELGDVGPASNLEHDTTIYTATVDAAVATCAPGLGAHSTEMTEIKYVIPAMVEACKCAVAMVAWDDATGNRPQAWKIAYDNAGELVSAKIAQIIAARG